MGFMSRYTHLYSLCTQFEKLANEHEKKHKSIEDNTKAYMQGWRDRAEGKGKRSVFEAHLRPHYEKGWEEAAKEFAHDEGVSLLRVIK